MNEAVVTNVPAAGKPLWRKIIAFPLVALVIALVVFMVPIAAFWPLAKAAGIQSLPGWVDRPFVAIGSAIIAFLVVKLVIARLGDHPRDDLPFDARTKDAAKGTVIAFALMSVIVAIAFMMGVYDIEGWGGSTSWRMMIFSAGIQAAIVEEILARGIIFRFLEEFGGSWFALALSSGLFGFGHYSNPNATLFSSIAIAIEAGVMLGGAYMLTRNLWLAIGLHFGWNVTQGYIWDVPVSGNDVDGLVESQPSGPEILSGGMFGLEASVIALVLATGLGIWFVYRAVQKGEVVRPWWVRCRLAREEAAALSA